MTAREPSAVEVIAEALDDHRRGESDRDCIEGIGWVWACWCECGWHGRDSDHLAHLAQAVLAAIRAMSPSEQAEVIGGGVERGWGNAGTAAPAERAYGPWREVQP